MTILRSRPILGGAAALTAALAAAVALAAPAEAKTPDTGDYAVTIGATTYNPAPGKDVKLGNIVPAGRIAVNGVHTRFQVDPATLGVYDYTLTGAPDAGRMVTAPTVVFASKVPTLSPAQLSGAKVSSLEVKDSTLVLVLSTSSGTLKVQAKDAPQGGIFQMESEFGAPVEFVHTLGSGLFYFVNAFTGKVNFGDGVDAVPASQDPVNSHQMLLGKDSPQVATKTFQGGTVTKWLVQPGGRLGGVLGEDSIELSQGATNCTSQCQAQNRINGSLTVPSDPVDPTPIAG
jgi:hypothetical protein